MDELRFRQIHLDFHTSPHLEGIGADFDADRFADTLAEAAVDSVTCFARCHHGWMYYPSKAHPDHIHPHLARKELLIEQIEACHARGIRVPIYTTIQWDDLTADQHPDWCTQTAEGRIEGSPPHEPGFYRYLKVNSPYYDFLCEHVEDLFDCLPAVDGLFFDIVQPRDDSSPQTLEQMRREGLDRRDPEARKAFGVEVINRFQRDMTKVVRKFSPDCTIFYNAGHVGPRHRRTVEAFSHFELESLPGGGWGYMHFPVTVRYARNLGHQTMGMTGKFHTSWGDFHSFKNPAALEFECFHMLAHGAKCSIGDQLPPHGQICEATYNLIGDVYRPVRDVEPWCRRARPITEIAVLTSEKPLQVRTGNDGPQSGRVPNGVIGATRMLQELACQFDILDADHALGTYKLLILPDRIVCDTKLARKIGKFIADGGKVIASYRSGLNEDGSAFALDAMGVKLVGDAPYSPDFIMPTAKWGKALPRTEHVMYLRGMQVKLDGAKTLAKAHVPYFNRTADHFCSHRHTPSSRRAQYPAITRCGEAIYFAHPIFQQYFDNAPRWCKTLVAEAIDALLPAPLLRHDGPSTMLATITEQKWQKRWMVHLLHYVPERRGQALDTIEEAIPLYDVTLSIRPPRKVKAVRTAPDGEALAFKANGDRLEVNVPKLEGRLMIELAF